MKPHIPITAGPAEPQWLTLHCPLGVRASPAFLATVPREAMVRVVRAYHRGFWGRIREEDRACHEGRAGFLTGCYSVAGVRVHVVTDHQVTRLILAEE